MAKDERLWMRFPIDIHRDPKVERLSPEVRWTFVEMNGEARLERNDGIFTKDDAEFLWPVAHLAALAASHPTEPLVIATGDTYVLRRYAKHQFTEADRAELASKRAEAGAAGGRKSGEARRKQAEARSKHLLSKPKQTEAESESESEIDDYTNTGPVSPVDDRARELGLTDRGIASIRNSISLHCDLTATIEEACGLAATIIAKAKTAPKSPAAYVRSAIETNPSEIDAWFRTHRRPLRAVGAGS